MTVPVFEKIELNNYVNEDRIREKLEESPVGHCPVYIPLPEMTKPKTLEFIVLLDSILRKMKVHPLYPYPVYIITKTKVLSQRIPVLTDIMNLPQMYRRSKQRSFTKQENQLLKKIEIDKRSFEGIEIDKRLREINLAKDKNRELYNIVRFNFFLRELINSEKIKIKLT